MASLNKLKSLSMTSRTPFCYLRKEDKRPTSAITCLTQLTALSLSLDIVTEKVNAPHHWLLSFSGADLDECKNYIYAYFEGQQLCGLHALIQYHLHYENHWCMSPSMTKPLILQIRLIMFVWNGLLRDIQCMKLKSSVLKKAKTSALRYRSLASTLFTLIHLLVWNYDMDTNIITNNQSPFLDNRLHWIWWPCPNWNHFVYMDLVDLGYLGNMDMRTLRK